jgi:serine/threonine protein kinase
MTPGTRLGPYEILARIGAGGMGEVWKARDTRLDRTVAIKISAEQFTERFEREARAVAALNHPNICTLYDVGPNYLVMEYIDGQPLKGPTAGSSTKIRRSNLRRARCGPQAGHRSPGPEASQHSGYQIRD